MSIYISGNYKNKEKFYKAENWLKQKGYEPINPINLSMALPHSLTQEQYAKIDYNLIEMCDAIFMLGGWQNDKLACAELQYAKSLGKKPIYQKYYERSKDNEIRTIQSDN